MTDLWAYTSRCDGDYCPGDCDRCGKAEEIYEEDFGDDPGSDGNRD